MAVKAGTKAKKRKKGGRAKASISVETDDDVTTTDLVNEPVDYPTDGTPHSEARMGFGLKVSKPGTYSSAVFEVEVMVPCNPGEEEAAADYAMGRVKNIFAKYDQEFEDTVESL